MGSESVVLRKAELSDIDRIVEFIRQSYYIKNHVFTRERRILNDWHIAGDNVWFVIGEGSESKKIYGIMGYRLYTQDKSPDVSLDIFQTIKSGDPTLGIRILQYMDEMYPGSCKCSSGVVPRLKGLYTYLGYQVGTLKHYYRLADRNEYKIAQIGKKIIPSVNKEGYTFKLFDSIQQIKESLSPDIFDWSFPRKNFEYIEHRYFKNIGYEYKVWGIFNSEAQCKGLLSGRDIQLNGAKCCKIVDFIGNDEVLRHCGAAFAKLIEDADYEYIDFYEIGIEDDIMTEAGFVLNDKTDNIIPHYFEPYVLENIDIYYCTNKTEKFHAYRSDGGQERPNFINK